MSAFSVKLSAGRWLASLLLLAVLTLAARPAAAQQDTLARRGPAAQPATAGATIDTAASLHHLFARQRRANVLTTGVAAGGVAVGYIMAATSNSYKELDTFILGASFVVGGVPLLVKGVVGLAAHSRAREQRIVLAWQQHRLPPRWLRRALRRDNIRYAPAPAGG